MRPFRFWPLILLALGACTADPGHDPTTLAIPNKTLAPIHMGVCKPGTFIGTMTVNCPQTIE